MKLAVRLSHLLVLIGLCLSAQVSAGEKVVVMTSYPQEVVTRFETAFENRHPEYRLEILWRQSRDAMTYLQKPDHGVDVYWTPSRHNFAELKKQGSLRQFDADIDINGVAESIGGYQLADPEHYYFATEIAGFGMALNKTVLDSRQLAVPRNWADIAAPGFEGLVALPVPSKVGFAPSLVDTLLQGYGWAEGWSLLMRIAANARLVDSGSTFITDEVASGRSAVGVTMDFFAASAIAKGLEIEFTYPELVGYSPAHVALLQASGNPDGARAFAAFTLSDEGQKLLFHPDIRKLPVKPLVYRDKPQGYFDPFAAAERVSYAYDGELGRKRQELVSALFDAVITHHHEALKRMWGVLHRAEKAAPGHPGLKEAVRLATALPFDERQANDPALHGLFSNRDADARTRASEIEKQWDAQVSAQYAQAEAMAREILDNAGKSSP